MFGKRLVERAPIEGKRVLVRVDYNVPLDGSEVADDTRIRASLPTLRLILERGGKPILVSHLGRPKGKVVEGLRMDPVASRVEELLGHKVTKAPGCVGSEVMDLAENLPAGELLLLENIRFHPEEEAGDDAFAERLAELGEYFVQDAFGTCHRAHASVVGVTHHLPSAAGLLLAREMKVVSRLFESPGRPFACIMGGAKVSDKIPIIHSLVEVVDLFVVGGAMAYTFLKASGQDVGGSLVEEDRLGDAGRIMETIHEKGRKIFFPVDHVVSTSLEDTRNVQTVESIPAGLMGLDIGPGTVELFREKLSSARTIVFNGPMGVFETPEFSAGTRSIVDSIAASDAFTVVGGGDSARAVKEFGAAEKVDHISTGGGAFLEILADRTLPGIEALDAESA